MKNYICHNRKARFEYEVLDTLEAGIVLQGTEIKSIRDHKISLDGAYATVTAEGVHLVGCNIDQYSHGNVHNHNPLRERRLLLHRTEIRHFAEKAKIKGFTLIPLAVYLVKGRAKVEIGVCKGKQLHDKRESLRKKDAKKQMKKV